MTRPDPIPARTDTQQRLADLPDLAAHLHLRMLTSAPGAEHGSKSDPARRAPGNIDVIHALDARIYPHRRTGQQPIEQYGRDADGDRGLPGELALWCRMMFEDLDGYEPAPDPLPRQTVASMCAWITRHYQLWASIAPDVVGELDAEIERWHTRLRRMLGETDPIQLRHRHLTNCGGLIDQTASGWFECRNCHQTWTGAQMMQEARFHADVTLAEAADQLGVTLGQLRQWKKRDHDFPKPVSKGHPARYWLRDLLQHVETRKRGA